VYEETKLTREQAA